MYRKPNNIGKFPSMYITSEENKTEAEIIGSNKIPESIYNLPK